MRRWDTTMSSSGFNRYYDSSYVDSGVAEGRHRQIVGGRWDEIGALQLEMLAEHGLKPDHKLLDVGCGCLRGGVHFVRYLEPGHYFGTDINQSLLDVGYDVELAKAGLQDRLSRTALKADGAFQFSDFNVRFDRAIAFSLFTHLPLNAIRVCLERLAEVMKPGGILHATFFELPDGAPSGTDIRHPPADVLTHGSADPYHHRVADFRYAAEGLPWDVRRSIREASGSSISCGADCPARSTRRASHAHYRLARRSACMRAPAITVLSSARPDASTS